eukprot:351127-Chlamydomonas_euryale.AAC.3
MQAVGACKQLAHASRLRMQSGGACKHLAHASIWRMQAVGACKQLAHASRWRMQAGGACKQVAHASKWRMQAGGTCKQVAHASRSRMQAGCACRHVAHASRLRMQAGGACKQVLAACSHTPHFALHLSSASRGALRASSLTFTAGGLTSASGVKVTTFRFLAFPIAALPDASAQRAEHAVSRGMEKRRRDATPRRERALPPIQQRYMRTEGNSMLLATKAPTYRAALCRVARPPLAGALRRQHHTPHLRQGVDAARRKARSLSCRSSRCARRVANLRADAGAGDHAEARARAPQSGPAESQASNFVLQPRGGRHSCGGGASCVLCRCLGGGGSGTEEVCRQRHGQSRRTRAVAVRLGVWTGPPTQLPAEQSVAPPAMRPCGGPPTRMDARLDRRTDARTSAPACRTPPRGRANDAPAVAGGACAGHVQLRPPLRRPLALALLAALLLVPRAAAGSKLACADAEPFQPTLRGAQDDGAGCGSLKVAIVNGVNYHFEIVAGLLHVLQPYQRQVHVYLSPWIRKENYDGEQGGAAVSAAALRQVGAGVDARAAAAW